MKKLCAFKVSLLISSTPVFAEAVPDAIGTLTPTQLHLYQIATISAKHLSNKLQLKKEQLQQKQPDPLFSREELNKPQLKKEQLQQKQPDPFFSREELNKLTERSQLKSFFGDVTTPANQNLLAAKPSLSQYTKISKTPTLSTNSMIFDSTNVSVVNTDTISAALSMPKDRSPAALNLANRTIPGGGVLSGSKAQEEDLCRATTLYVSLDAAKRAGAYPLGSFEALYSPNVLAHEQASAKPFSIITLGGYRVTPGRIDPADYPGPVAFYNGMLDKARIILDTALAHGHVDIVLGALGCGAFAQDANKTVVEHIAPDVARAFAEVLTEKHPATKMPRFRHFRNIQFAILENPTNTRLGNEFRHALGIISGTKTAWDSTTPPAIPNKEKAHFSSMNIALTQSLKLKTPFFTDNTFSNTTSKYHPPQLWAGKKAPWPISIGGYTLDSHGTFTITVSFAYQNGVGAARTWYTTRVDFSGYANAINQEAKTWLARRFSPGRPIPAAAPQPPVLDLRTIDLNGVFMTHYGFNFFVNTQYSIQPVGSAQLWTGPLESLPPINFGTYAVNPDGSFILTADFAHSDSQNNWYTTPIKIIGALDTLSYYAKNWLDSAFDVN